MKVVGIIPSRLQSSRLPQKALIDIDGLPMVVHVLKRAQMSLILDKVCVATDSAEIFDAVVKHGGEALMTSNAHKNGTERVAEASKHFNADIIVNIQGDEPLLDPSHIDEAVKALQDDRDINVSIPVTAYSVKNSSSDIKAVLDKDNNILYCSRTDLPSDARGKVSTMWKMCFIVPFRKSFLSQYVSWAQTPLERAEYNEYLRILENGHKIKAVQVRHAEISVDTPEDLAIVREKMKKDKLKNSYNRLV